MIFLTTNSNGENKEGIGAIVQIQLFCYALAKKCNVGFVFSKFENFSHYQYYNVSQDKFMDDVNSFFNFQSEIENQEIEKISLRNFNESSILELKQKYQTKDVIIDLNGREILRLANSLMFDIEINSIFNPLKMNLFLHEKFKYIEEFATHKCVTIHIRKYTKTDNCNSHIRDLFDKSKESFYVNLINSLSKKYQNQKLIFRIYAQGSAEEYQFLSKLQLPHDHILSFHIEEYPIISLYYMIKSDILVMSNSSFSWIAHLYGNHEIVYYKQKFNMPIRSNARLLKTDGNL
jgi:hypothetical protein